LVAAATGVVEAIAEVRPISGAEWFMAVVTASLVGDMVLRDAAMRIAE
jgi:hypothetical protein